MTLNKARRRVYALLEQGPVGNPGSRLVNTFLILVISISLLAAIFETVPEFRSQYYTVLRTIDLIAFVVFFSEFVLRVWTASEHAPLRDSGPLRARLRYIMSPLGLIDAITLLPFLLTFITPSDLRTFVVLRVIRFLKLTRYSPAIRSLLDALHAERRALAGCLILVFGVALCAAALMHMAEADAQPDKFGTLPDAMWWAIVTLGTVGYGDAVPLTALGRLIATGTIIMGVIMMALPIGIIATAFANEIHRRDFVITWGLVARVPLFRELSPIEIADVMRLLRAQKVEAGTIISRKGEQARSMYLVVAGEVEIRLDGKNLRLGAGHFFGEIALLGHRHRSATVTALQATSLLVLDAEDFEVLMERNPRIAQRIQDAVRERQVEEPVSLDGDIAKEELSEAVQTDIPINSERAS